MTGPKQREADKCFFFCCKRSGNRKASGRKGDMGMDREFIIKYLPLYVEAAKLTLGIGLVGIILSLLVALADLMYVAKDLIGLYYKTDEALLMLVIAYLIILLPVSLLAAVLERRLRYAEFGD